MPLHTDLSSSSKHARRAGCAGSYAAEMAVPKEERDKPSKASIDGTRRHLLAEWRFDHPNDSDPGTLTDDEGTVHMISRDDQLAVDKVWPYVLKHPAYINLGKPGHLALAEQQADYGRYCGIAPEQACGIADVVLVQPGVLEVCDYKFGRYPVSPDSWQFKTLAVGVIGDLLLDPEQPGQFRSEFRQTRVIKLTVLQPEAPEPVRSVEFDLSVIGQWMESIKTDLAAVQQPDAQRTPGEWCKFCAAAGSCPTRMAAAGRAVQEMFEPVESVTGAPAPIASVDQITDLVDVRMTQDPESLTPEEIGRICDQALLVEGWFKDVRARRDALLTAGKPVAGWKLVAGPRKREWAQDEAETAALLRKWLKAGDLYSRKLISPAQAEKLEECVKTGKRKEQLETMIRVTDGKPKAVPESDPHPAIREAETMFEAVPESAPSEPKPEIQIPGFL